MTLEALIAILHGSIEMGIIYAIMTLGVFISFRTLNMPDMTVDGSFVLGAAISAVLCTGGYPVLGLIIAFIAGAGAGSITALLHTKLKIQPLLAGILMMLALYSINIKVMGKKSNIPLNNKPTIFTPFEDTALEDNIYLIICTGILLVLLISLFLFLRTRLGFVLRATGDNEDMVRALGVNTDTTKLIGLAIANGLTALSGAIIAQYQSFADVGMGIGMVTIGLASVIIGEVIWEAIFGIKSLLRRLLAVVLGAIIYRLVIALALEIGMPATDLKLISAIIVASALSIPAVRDRLNLMRKRIAAANKNKGV